VTREPTATAATMPSHPTDPVEPTRPALTFDKYQVLQQQGRPAEVRPLLGETLAWFTQGRDTADLRQARELLDRL
jgi:hypothetical protein